jgi:hypothetical protein
MAHLLGFGFQRFFKCIRIASFGSFTSERVKIAVMAFGFAKWKMDVKRLHTDGHWYTGTASPLKVQKPHPEWER